MKIMDFYINARPQREGNATLNSNLSNHVKITMLPTIHININNPERDAM
jgi:hypothetical protein